MLCDFSKFKQINNSYDLAWFLGVDHHNFKRLIRHMISNKECTIMDKKSVTGMRYHPPHSNRSMHVYKLTENQVRFLVTRQSVFWASTFFTQLVEHEPDLLDQPADFFRPVGTKAFWELDAEARKTAYRCVATFEQAKAKQILDPWEITSVVVAYAFKDDGTLWVSEQGDYFDEMVEN